MNISILFKVDDCASNPCFVGVHCTDMVASFSCGPCPSGYTGNGETCTRIDGSMYYIFWIGKPKKIIMAQCLDHMYNNELGQKPSTACYFGYMYIPFQTAQ